jgi:eukaryotic-like serine/threonine-protein kinase
VIRRDLVGDPDFRRRFRGEVEAARRVPGFCTAEVLDADPDHDPPYLVVEYVDGPTLSDVVEERGPLGGANLHGLAIGVATALTGIHGAGVIHRDLKPSNVLLALGSAKVIDFGIARPVDPADGPGTDPNQLLGTIAYMAPERLSTDVGRTLTAAADVFSWAAVITFAGTGRTPFGGDGIAAATRILTGEPDLTGLNGILLDLVSWALTKDPAARPTSRELLDRLVSQSSPSSETALIEAGSRQAVVSVAALPKTQALSTAWGRPRPRHRRWPVPVLATGLLAAATVVALLLTGTIGPFSGVAQPAASGSTPTAPVSPSPDAPSSTSSATPSSTLSATPSATPSGPAPWQVFVRDPLTKPGPFWKDRDDTLTLQAKCTVSGALVVTQTRLSTYRCPSHPDPFTDLAVSVDVVLRTADTCAGIWFRFVANKGYLLTACHDRYQLYEHAEALTLVRTMALPAPVKTGTRFRTTVSAQGTSLRFVHNGQELASLRRSTYESGRVVPGIFVPDGAKQLDAYEVAFNNIEISTAPNP